MKKLSVSVLLLVLVCSFAYADTYWESGGSGVTRTTSANAACIGTSYCADTPSGGLKVNNKIFIPGTGGQDNFLLGNGHLVVGNGNIKLNNGAMTITGAAGQDNLVVNAGNVKLNNGFLSVKGHNDGSDGRSYVTIGNGAEGTMDLLAATFYGYGYNDISGNAYWDGSNWYRRDTAFDSWLWALNVKDTGGELSMYHANPGIGAISWGTPYFKIASNGKVGIGTSGPDTTFHVAGNAKVETSSGVALQVLSTGSNAIEAQTSATGFDAIKAVAWNGGAALYGESWGTSAGVKGVSTSGWAGEFDGPDNKGLKVTGKVAIYNDAPTQELDINGQLRLRNIGKGTCDSTTAGSLAYEESSYVGHLYLCKRTGYSSYAWKEVQMISLLG